MLCAAAGSTVEAAASSIAARLQSLADSTEHASDVLGMGVLSVTKPAVQVVPADNMPSEFMTCEMAIDRRINTQSLKPAMWCYQLHRSVHQCDEYYSQADGGNVRLCEAVAGRSTCAATRERLVQRTPTFCGQAAGSKRPCWLRPREPLVGLH